MLIFFVFHYNAFGIATVKILLTKIVFKIIFINVKVIQIVFKIIFIKVKAIQLIVGYLMWL